MRAAEARRASEAVRELETELERTNAGHSFNGLNDRRNTPTETWITFDPQMQTV
jgi:hypothetical protein